MTKIAIVDDHKLFSSGLALLLDELSGETSVICFSTPDEFLSAKSQHLDLVVLDFYVPGFSFIDSYQKIADVIECPIIVVSASPSPADQRQALATGASVFVSKHAEPEELLAKVKDVLLGNFSQSDETQHSATTRSFAEFGLTRRQVEILLLVAKGYSNKEIAAAFEISPETVKSHMKSVFRNIKVQSRIEALEFVRQHGLF